MSKYLGAPSDPGEWWASRTIPCSLPGMPAATITLRIADDARSHPYLFAAYGLREWVDLDAARVGIARAIETYDRPDRITGPAPGVDAGLWKNREETIAVLLRKQQDAIAIQRAGRIATDGCSLAEKERAVASGDLTPVLRQIAWSCTGSAAIASATAVDPAFVAGFRTLMAHA